jgi:hypothetical protein
LDWYFVSITGLTKLYIVLNIFAENWKISDKLGSASEAIEYKPGKHSQGLSRGTYMSVLEIFIPAVLPIEK